MLKYFKAVFLQMWSNNVALLKMQIPNFILAIENQNHK